MAYGDGMIGFRANTTDSVPTQPLGKVVALSDGGCAFYVGVASNVTANMACIMNATGYIQPITTTLATELSGNSGDRFVVAAATLTTAQYGYAYGEGPNLTITCAASVAADSQLYTTSTPGTIDDASAGVKLPGVVCSNGTGAAAAGNYTCRVWNPQISQATALA